MKLFLSEREDSLCVEGEASNHIFTGEGEPDLIGVRRLR